MSNENQAASTAAHEEEIQALLEQGDGSLGKGEKLFGVCCAVIFLGMIGLVFINACLRYFFRSSFDPSEEWARFLFMYITFIGGIEAFYRHRHIAVDMLTSHVHGVPRKVMDVVAALLMLGALVLLFWGGIEAVRQTMDTYAVATGINMGFVNGSLPLMAGVAILIHLRDMWKLFRTPADEINPVVPKENQ